MNTDRLFQEAFDAMVNRYEGIFKTFYPAYGSTGFTERNLTNNLVFGLEKALGSRTYSWFELPTGETKIEHFDAAVWNNELEFFAFIEAKRFSQPIPKLISILKDLSRMADASRFKAVKVSSGNNMQVILLADVWTETQEKTTIFNSWAEGYLQSQHQKLFSDGFLNFQFPTCLSNERYFKHKFDNLDAVHKSYSNYSILMYTASANL